MFPFIHSKTVSLEQSISPFSILSQIFKLYWFCCRFITISVLVLPFVLITQFLAVHLVATHCCFLPLFSRTHHFAKTVVYTTVELLKRIPLGVIGLFRYKHFVVKQCFFQYTYFYIVCIDIWKKAIVTPIFNSGRQSDLNNYRPISVLSAVSRIFEKVARDKLFEFLTANNLLSKSQFAYRKLHSTITSLLNVTDSWYSNVIRKNLSISLFLDLKKHSIPLIMIFS